MIKFKVYSCFCKKIGNADIKTAEQLPEACATKKGREKVAADTGIDEGKLLTWTNMADLFRIKAVSSQYAELLHAAGINSVKELKHRKPENLHAKMLEVNEEKKLVCQVSALSMVENFVKQAAELPPVITH